MLFAYSLLSFVVGDIVVVVVVVAVDAVIVYSCTRKQKLAKLFMIFMIVGRYPQALLRVHIGIS